MFCDQFLFDIVEFSLLTSACYRVGRRERKLYLLTLPVSSEFHQIIVAKTQTVSFILLVTFWAFEPSGVEECEKRGRPVKI